MQSLERSFAASIIWYTLLVLCGVGLLLAWMPDGIAWSLFEASIFALLIAWAAGWALGAFPAAWPRIALPIAGVILWGLIQVRMGWTAYFFASQMDLVRWGCFFSILFLAYQLSGVTGRARAFRRIFTTYSLPLAVVSVLQLFAGNGKIFWLFHTDDKAALGPFLNVDHYASFVALVLPMTAFEMVQHRRRRWFFAITTAALYASVVAGASRAGFVLVSLELVLMFAIIGFRHRTVPAVAALLVAFVLVVGWQTLYQRLRAPDPYNGRREVAEATVKMIRANPWKGYGLGTWTEVYPAFATKDFGVFVNAAHSDWLQWWAEGGVPVVACLAIVFVSSILIAPRLPWAMGIPIVFLHSLVDFPLQGRFLPSMLFLVLGVAARRVKRSRSKPSEPSASPTHDMIS